MADATASAVKDEGPVFDIDSVRADFPILNQEVYKGKPLVFLDSGASAQKPKAVLDAVNHCYETYYANVHRGAHRLSQLSTDAYEDARADVARFMNAAKPEEIVFAKNVTEAINLIVWTYAFANMAAGDEVIISEAEHHANIVPWQMLREVKGIEIKIAPIDDDGVFLLDEFEKLLGPKTKIVAVTHVSNVLGTVYPVRDIIRLAHDHGAVVMLDGAQGIVHGGVDVQDLDVDFYCWTGHKLYGPSGIGVLYAKWDILNAMPPFLGGGDMIERVTFEKSTYAEPPARFEAGTPPIAQAIGLAAAVRYVEGLGFEAIEAHEQDLLRYATQRLSAIEGLRIIGTAPGKGPIVSFLVDGLHPLDTAAVMDRQGVACRVGHHCAEPLMDRLGIVGTVRASIGLYNNRADIDALAESIEKAKALLG